MELLASQRMIQIHLHMFTGNLHDGAVETLTLAIGQRHYRPLEDVSAVNLSVGLEDVARNRLKRLLHIWPIGIVYAQSKVESLSFCQGSNLCLKSIQGEPHSGNKLEGMVGWSLFNQFAPASLHGCIELVCHCNVLVGFVHV